MMKKTSAVFRQQMFSCDSEATVQIAAEDRSILLRLGLCRPTRVEREYEQKVCSGGGGWHLVDVLQRHDVQQLREQLRPLALQEPLQRASLQRATGLLQRILITLGTDSHSQSLSTIPENRFKLAGVPGQVVQVADALKTLLWK